MEAINILAILAAVVVNMIAGSIWYGPLLGRKWLAATGRDPQNEQVQGTLKKDMPIAMGAMLLFTAVTAVILSILTYRYSGNLAAALFLALMLWLGFALPTKINDVLFGGQNRQLLWIDSVWMLVSILLSTLVVFFWR